MSRDESSSGVPGAVILVLSILGVLVLILGAVAIIILRNFDTQYASGYSEKAFKSIQLGDSETRVKSLLGAPLSTYDSEPYVEWIYSADEQKRFAVTGYASGTFTTIRFNPDGRVANILGQRQTSPNTMTIGEGQNSLNLSSEQIKALRGSTQDDIRKKSGAPKATYDYKVRKVLCYSRSPSSGHYHLRSVGLDQNGKVVHLWREIYWD